MVEQKNSVWNVIEGIDPAKNEKTPLSRKTDSKEVDLEKLLGQLPEDKIKAHERQVRKKKSEPKFKYKEPAPKKEGLFSRIFSFFVKKPRVGNSVQENKTETNNENIKETTSKNNLKNASKLDLAKLFFTPKDSPIQEEVPLAPVVPSDHICIPIHAKKKISGSKQAKSIFKSPLKRQALPLAPPKINAEPKQNTSLASKQTISSVPLAAPQIDDNVCIPNHAKAKYSNLSNAADAFGSDNVCIPIHAKKKLAAQKEANKVFTARISSMSEAQNGSYSLASPSPRNSSRTQEKYAPNALPDYMSRTHKVASLTQGTRKFSFGKKQSEKETEKEQGMLEELFEPTNE